jgi:SAM-dependent methyltransferase
MKSDEKEASKFYNKVAGIYHDMRTKDHPEGWFYNELLEMPAVLELLGNVRGKKILDFGCGTGIYAKMLTKKGAIVKGFDISKEMINIAKKNNPELDLKVGSGYKIPFHEKFDIVIACLVMDYFEDWNKVFREVSRVLKQGGAFIFSVGNPVSECVKKIDIRGKKVIVFGKVNYFDEKNNYAKWKFVKIPKKKIKVPSYHKTYETVIKTILQNSFSISGYKDAFPARKAKTLFPEDYARFSKQPYFCVWRARKD